MTNQIGRRVRCVASNTTSLPSVKRLACANQQAGETQSLCCGLLRPRARRLEGGSSPIALKCSADVAPRWRSTTIVLERQQQEPSGPAPQRAEWRYRYEVMSGSSGALARARWCNTNKPRVVGPRPAGTVDEAADRISDAGVPSYARVQFAGTVNTGACCAGPVSASDISSSMKLKMALDLMSRLSTQNQWPW